MATSSNGTLNYTIPSGGTGNYYAIVQAAPANQGIRAQYLLNANVVDGVAPTVTSVAGVPAPGETSNALVDQITLGFSTNLIASTVNNPANYSLTDSHGNTYTLAPSSYGGGLSETLTFAGGPLQPGSYTFSVGSGLIDRAQNQSTPFQQQFTIVQVPGYVTQGAYDNSVATATPLVATELAQSGNLLINPGAEDGNLTGWTVGGNSNPGVDNGSFDPGINPHTGNYDFYGHTGSFGTLTQNVALTGIPGLTTGQIDSGLASASVTFWEQGLNQGTPSDEAQITLTFLNASNSAISSVSTPEVDSHNGTWEEYSRKLRSPQAPAPSITRWTSFATSAVTMTHSSTITV